MLLQADKSQAKFLGELPEELEEMEGESRPISPSERMDVGEASSSEDKEKEEMNKTEEQNSSHSKESDHLPPGQDKESSQPSDSDHQGKTASALTTVVQDEGSSHPTSTQDRTPSNGSSAIQVNDSVHTAAVQDKEACTSEAVDDATSPAAAVTEEQSNAKPPIVSLE